MRIGSNVRVAPMAGVRSAAAALGEIERQLMIGRRTNSTWWGHQCGDGENAEGDIQHSGFLHARHEQAQFLDRVDHLVAAGRL